MSNEATFESEFKYARSREGLVAQKKMLRDARSRCAEAKGRATTRFKRLREEDPRAARQLEAVHAMKLQAIDASIAGFDRMIQECRRRLEALGVEE